MPGKNRTSVISHQASMQAAYKQGRSLLMSAAWIINAIATGECTTRSSKVRYFWLASIGRVVCASVAIKAIHASPTVPLGTRADW